MKAIPHRPDKTLPPPGAWYAVETVWGAVQRVRLTTGLPCLITDPDRIRSIHVVGFVQEDRVLLVQNRDETWTFPGGRLEEQETLDQALTREVWEEARAILAPEVAPIAATRIEFLNRVPGRVYRVHPSFLLWVRSQVVQLSESPHHDPADYVLRRYVASVCEAEELLGSLETIVLKAALAYPSLWDE